MADEFNTFGNTADGSQEQNYTAENNSAVNGTAAENTVNASADNQTADSVSADNAVNGGTEQTAGNSYANGYTANNSGVNNTAYNGYYGQQNGTDKRSNRPHSALESVRNRSPRHLLPPCHDQDDRQRMDGHP